MLAAASLATLAVFDLGEKRTLTLDHVDGDLRAAREIIMTAVLCASQACCRSAALNDAPDEPPFVED
jgi:hypothetical protein